MVGKKKVKSFRRGGINFIDLERKRISEELHDNVSSKLAVIQYTLHHNPNAVQEVLNLLDNVIGSVRIISHGLHSPFLDKISFLDAVRDFVLPLHGAIDVKIEYFSKQNTVLPKKNRLHLFRIFQEIINNILKHAKASQVAIRIHYSNNYLNLFIQDNGIGFNYDSFSTMGLGMESIRHRAKELNAKFKFKHSENKGTLFIISVPFNDK